LKTHFAVAQGASNDAGSLLADASGWYQAADIARTKEQAGNNFPV